MFFWNSLAFFMTQHVGNLISVSSAFSKTSLNIWKFKVHVLLKPGLENVEYYFTSVWPTMTKLMEKGIEVMFSPTLALFGPLIGIHFLQQWAQRKEIPHVQGQRRCPSKMVGGANLHLESNSIPTSDTKRAQTNLVCTRTHGPHRDWDRTVFEYLLCRYGSAVDCHRDRGSGCSRLGYGISPLEEGLH